MLTQKILKIIHDAKGRGWIMEPEAKQLLSLAGLDVPRMICTNDVDEATGFAEKIGYPVVAKIVSPKVVHKSDVGGVVPHIGGPSELRNIFNGFKKMPGFTDILVEEMIPGLELIIGGKMDYQFGPVVLFGIGGTKAEIYRDTTLRMAPLSKTDVVSMVKDLQAHALIEGYRGSDPVNMEALSQMMMSFSNLMMGLEDHVESIDLNPVICSSKHCVVADARIILDDRA